MARQKQPSIRREPSDLFKQNGSAKKHSIKIANGDMIDRVIEKQLSNGAPRVLSAQPPEAQAGILQLGICVAGIYASFLAWAFLQERITTTRYGPPSAPETFTYSVFLNTVQSAFAFLSGYAYLLLSTPSGKPTPSILPSASILPPLLLVAVTSSLASPFGYASLAHIDYITFILAKSCKLLPVMFLHISIFRKRYPLYKYAVVGLVTLGVALFTLHAPTTSKKRARAVEGSSAWGLLLLGINLLFDGLTNSVQDHVFATWRRYTGPQMMCAQNLLSTALTLNYLFVSPYVARTGLGAWLGMQASGAGELGEALAFVRRYPQVGWDVLAFAGCGAIGQIFIYYTLSHFSSLLLVTVTVTRKMLTMLFSVVYFGHKIQGMQWLGVGLVFGGIGAEAGVKVWNDKAKKKSKGAAGEKKEL
ncbi:UDP-galactose transporter [Coniosporium tulheliwenetii]|uniref:UDP-galactose transporter n=1 Tax=Coniosporium tulheliwenetii TaxID=3383036 RepID=A0ACC2YPF7_9PEZI|nr:UDP-galactose transporter [Cladosporium sp. JES 115]